MTIIKEIKEVLERAIHPEFNKSLIRLGMIRDIKVEHHRRTPKNLRKRFLLGAKNKVTIVLVLPFLYVPIKGQLVKIIKKIIRENLGIIPIIKIKEMNQKEKKKFGNMIKKIKKIENSLS